MYIAEQWAITLDICYMKLVFRCQACQSVRRRRHSRLLVLPAAACRADLRAGLSGSTYWPAASHQAYVFGSGQESADAVRLRLRDFSHAMIVGCCQDTSQVPMHVITHLGRECCASAATMHVDRRSWAWAGSCHACPGIIMADWPVRLAYGWRFKEGASMAWT